MTLKTETFVSAETRQRGRPPVKFSACRSYCAMPKSPSGASGSPRMTLKVRGADVERNAISWLSYDGPSDTPPRNARGIVKFFPAFSNT